MKKIFIVGVAAICLAFAAPAMAKVTVSGMITTDLYYMDQSSERVTANGRVQNAAATADDFQEFNIHVPQAHNRLIVGYKNDDGTLTGHMQLRGGGSNGGNTIDFKYAWFDYKLNDMVHFRFGRQPQAFAVMTPGAANMGFHDNFTLLVNYGNFQITDADSVKAYVKFNDTVRLEIQLEDPRGNEGGIADTAANRSNPVIPITEQNTLPKIDLALPLSFGNIKIEPSFTYLQNEYEGKQGDDNIDMWGFCVGAKAGFGPVTISGEITYGENLGMHNHTGGGNGGPAFAAQARSIAAARLLDGNGDGINEVYDAEIFAGWIQFAFNFGPATLQFAIGIEDIENDGTSAANDEVDLTRFGYAVSLPIKVAKNFTVAPAVIYHDRDSDALDGVNGPLTVDYGDEILVGVQFSLRF